MVNKQFTINEKCLDCTHLGYCQPYWGAACKRQGGDRLPRLKSVWAQLQPSENDMINVQPQQLKKTKISLYQPIKTKHVNWEHLS